MNEPETILRGLIGEFVGRLTRPVVDHVYDLLNNGEPGIAIEELCAYIDEQEISVDARQAGVIKTLGQAFHVDAKWWATLRIV